MGSFATTIADSEKGLIALYRAKTKEGKDFFAYIRCNQRGFFKMKHDFETNTPCTDVTSYGKAIYMGFGKDPDEAAEAFLRTFLNA